MKIVLQEMKKIVSGKKLLCLAGFGFLYFLMGLRPYIRTPAAASYHAEADIVQSFVEEYGTELGPEEFRELKEKRPAYVYMEIDDYIAANEEFGRLGIRNFAQLSAKIGGQELSFEEQDRLWRHLNNVFSDEMISEKTMELITYQIWDIYITAYERETSGQGTMYYDNLEEIQRGRVAERGEKEVYSLLPAGVAGDNFQVLRFVGVFMAFSMMFMILPYMVSENRSRMPALQYSFKKGRGFYRCRLAAVLLSCLLLAALEAAVYFCIAEKNRVTEFWDCSLSACSSGFISWFPWTVGQYTLFYLAAAAAFSVGLSLAVFTATDRQDNYITAIARQLPLLVGGGVFCGFVMFAFDEITKPKGLVPLVCALAAAGGLLAALIQGLVEKRRDM